MLCGIFKAGTRSCYERFQLNRQVQTGELSLARQMYDCFFDAEFLLYLFCDDSLFGGCDVC